MTDHTSSADGTGSQQPSGQFGPADQAAWQQAQNQQAQTQGQYGQHPQARQPQAQATPGTPYGYPTAATQAPQPQANSEAARAQVAAAWARRAPQAPVPPGEAAVPALPPRSGQNQDGTGQNKKDKREQARAERKAAYERKKAEREARKETRKGGGKAAAPVGVAGSPSAGSETAGTAGAAAPERPAKGSAAVGAPGRAGGFDVPRPGGRLPASGRRTHVALRATLLFTTCAFALGSCGVVGLAIGKSSTPQTAALDKEDVQRFRLTEFPTRAAATFAEDYATRCLTYDPKAADARRDELARFATAGVDTDCGWNGVGTQSVTLAAWDGSVEELPEYGKYGRYLGVQVTLSNGRVTTVSVPVYVADLAAASGLRVVGDVGEMPLPVRGAAPEVDRDEEVLDTELSDQLKERVLPGYFTAWGTSDTTAMSRFTTSDASLTATTGLRGALSAPRVHEVQALAPKGVGQGDTITYKDGQTVQARVTVVWGGASNEDGGVQETTTTIRRSYRVTIVNTAQGWFIQDIRGGVLDPAGGRSDTEESSAATPSPGQSAPANSTGDKTKPEGTATPSPDGEPGGKPNGKPADGDSSS
ncbi:conjugal transfer protein [Streptomyces sp. MUM 203J]|uniref:conjugal transfer protein n=1 Tax=Streptomyces sp. MUM 203J TaxID=2791990 RepID=UPI001F03DD4B|nr:conjugal transfer protein [Streptomyces sp. MUM 203J]MCH0542664.1 conjugal transfer protein [Streptomyces sp. MUM 203J]